MSAFVVTHSTIAAVVTYAQRRLCSCTPPPPCVGIGTGNMRDIDLDQIGQALLAENTRSVNHRYRQQEPIATYRHTPNYAGAVSGDTMRLLTALDVIKLCQCLKYQCCEHPEWQTSWANAFLQNVVETAVKVLPGYDDAPWGLYATLQSGDTCPEIIAQLADTRLPRLLATFADATLPDDVRRQAMAALLQGCTVSDILMHLRDACRDEAKRFASYTLPHAHFRRAAMAIQHLRETTDI